MILQTRFNEKEEIAKFRMRGYCVFRYVPTLASSAGERDGL